MEKDAVYEKIGRQIRSARVERGLKQEQIARFLDLTRTAVTNIETGRQGIQVHQLMMIADVLEVSLSDLLEDVATSSRKSEDDSIADLPENLASMVSKYQSRLTSR